MKVQLRLFMLAVTAAVVGIAKERTIVIWNYENRNVI